MKGQLGLAKATATGQHNEASATAQQAIALFLTSGDPSIQSQCTFGRTY